MSTLQATDGIRTILRHVHEKGVRLSVEDGQLRYKALKNTLTLGEIEQLRAHKSQIVGLLERGRGEVSGRRALQTLGWAPLSFSQLQHWNFYGLGKRRAVRHLAAALQISGPLNVAALRAALAEVVRRHDALRTRIAVYDEIPLQETATTSDAELKVEDLTSVADRHREAEARSRIEQLILEPIDACVGPLFEVKLLRLGECEHVLAVAMEHIISDMCSLNIFLRELLTAYAQAARGAPFSLPPVPVQFSDYAVLQRREQPSWIHKHAGYWKERLSGMNRLRFPDDPPSPGRAVGGWAMAPVVLGSDMSAELREWCRQRQTTTVMSLFAAYAALVLRWCSVSETVIRHESNGRFDEKVTGTIGYFSAPLFLRVALSKQDRFIDFLNRIVEEYVNACEHRDSSYLEAQLPRPEVSRNTAFNWVSDGSKDAMNCRTFPFENPFLKDLERDTEPFILFGEDAMHTLASGHADRARIDGQSGISGGVYYPCNRFSVQTMQRFAKNFTLFVEALLRQPSEPVNDVRLLR